VCSSDLQKINLKITKIFTYFVTVLTVLVFIDIGIRLISFTNLFNLMNRYSIQFCNEGCEAYKDWIESDPANREALEHWKTLWGRFHKDTRFAGRMFSPPLPDPKEPFIYPPGQRTFTSKNQNGELIHTVKVNIDEHGWRATPHSVSSGAAETYLFIGDSTTLGYGVSDDQTFASYFAASIKNAEVLNLGRLYAGPNDFLYYLRDNPKILLPKVAAKKITVIYTYADLKELYGRTFMSSAFADLSGYKDFSNKPFYEFENGQLVFKDTFFDHKARRMIYRIMNFSAFHQVLGYEWPGHTKANDAAFSAFFTEIKKFLMRHYSDAEVSFYLAAYPYKASQPSCKVIALLKEGGIKTLHFADTAIENVLPPEAQVTPVEVHPTPLANRLYAKMLYDYFSSTLPKGMNPPDQINCSETGFAQWSLF